MDRAKQILKDAKVDTIFLINTKENDPNFIYLAGFTQGNFESDMLLATKKETLCIISPLAYAVAKKQNRKGIKIINSREKKVTKMLKKSLKGKVVGVSGNFLPLRTYKIIKKMYKPKRIVDLTKIFVAARSVKDKEEISRIRIANKIVKRALKNVQSMLKEGVTEREIARKIDNLMIDYGASAPSFESIVSFGANAAVSHHVPDNTKLKKNEFVLFDCGALYKNYCSDVSRTIIFKPDLKSEKYKRMSDMINTVKQAQQLAMRYIKSGTRQSVPHIKAENYINKANKEVYKGTFWHALGHSVGIEVHDHGVLLSPSSKFKLKENMVVSNEPGIYIERFGGVRIEDDILVTKSGGKII